MRTAKLKIDGEEHLLCFSLRVMRDSVERYGGMDGLYAAISDKDPVKILDETVWILTQLMQAGARYAEMNGIKNPEPLSYDDMYDACDMAELSGLRGKVLETITSGKTHSVEAEPPKKGSATREEAR